MLSFFKTDVDLEKYEEGVGRVTRLAFIEQGLQRRSPGGSQGGRGGGRGGGQQFKAFMGKWKGRDDFFFPYLLDTPNQPLQ